MLDPAIHYFSLFIIIMTEVANLFEKIQRNFRGDSMVSTVDSLKREWAVQSPFPKFVLYPGGWGRLSMTYLFIVIYLQGHLFSRFGLRRCMSDSIGNIIGAWGMAPFDGCSLLLRKLLHLLFFCPYERRGMTEFLGVCKFHCMHCFTQWF